MKKTLYVLSMSTLAFFLVSCGGASKNALYGMKIEGVGYETSSGSSGKTDKNGSFKFKEGDTVTFSLGKVKLLEVKAQNDMSLAALADLETIPQVLLSNEVNARDTGFNEKLRRAFNVAILLASLDKDKDLSNGIEITEATFEKFEKNNLYPLNFYHPNFVDQCRKVLYQLEMERPVIKPLKLIRTIIESGAMGEVVFYETAKIKYDGNANGVVDEIITRSYDEFGNIQKETHDENANGVPESITKHKSDIYGNGLLSQYDSNGDGVQDHIYSSEVDEDGYPILFETDNDGDGTFESREHIVRNAYGDPVRNEQDDGANGSIDDIETYTYDQNGNLIVRQRDSDADGVANSVTYYSYDDRGNVLTRLTLYTNPSEALLRTYTYDDDNNAVLIEDDDDANGVLDYVVRRKFNSLHQETESRFDNDGNGTYEQILTLTYNKNANNNIATFGTDSNADGNVDDITIYTYNADGFLEKYEEDLAMDDVIDYVSKSFYEGTKLIREEIDEDADGSIDSISTYEYKEFENVFPFMSFQVA
jgi:hypothetical protein